MNVHSHSPDELARSTESPGSSQILVRLVVCVVLAMAVMGLASKVLAMALPLAS